MVFLSFLGGDLGKNMEKSTQKLKIWFMFFLLQKTCIKAKNFTQFLQQQKCVKFFGFFTFSLMFFQIKKQGNHPVSISTQCIQTRIAHTQRRQLR